MLFVLGKYYYNGFGNTTSVAVGDNTIVSYTYNQNNGKIASLTYANGLTEEYVYNALEFLTKIWYTVNGTKLLSYTYDSWGRHSTERYATGFLATAAASNPFRYRGYYYDADLNLYLLGTRYYDPEIRRFISPDNASVTTATPMSLTDKNLYAYCDNNPVMRVDYTGEFWDTVFDVISLGASIVEVCINPVDIWAWAGLVGDAIDLIPFVTGVGEMTRAVKTTVKVVENADDVVDAAKTIYKTADAASDIKKATGSYEIIYKSGKNYIGKGGFDRAIASATRNAAKGSDEVMSIMWKSAPNHRAAFIDEYMMQKRFGGVLSSDKELLTYNKIWSPGRRFWYD